MPAQRTAPRGGAASRAAVPPAARRRGPWLLLGRRRRAVTRRRRNGPSDRTDRRRPGACSAAPAPARGTRARSTGGPAPMLPSHGRYGYHPWPGPAALALAGRRQARRLSRREPGAFRLRRGARGRARAWCRRAVAASPDVLNYAWRDYGNRVGAWRLLELLDQLRLPATVLLNSAMYDHAPALVAAHRARGDEIAGHGRTNCERQIRPAGGRGARADRRGAPRPSRGTRARRRAAGSRPGSPRAGRRPTCWPRPATRYTLNWCMDDQPVWMRRGPGGCWPSPTRRRSTTSPRSWCARTARSSSPP